jgi:Signal transduction histidine kinase
MRSTLEQYGHMLDLRLAPQPVFVDGDAVRLTQVVVNLLNNAAKFTAPKGRIEVCVVRNHAAVRVEVSDNGIGMSESLLQRAFDPFVQGERSLDRSEGGLGIGLTLVKKIVELHGGSVVASSAGAGMGTKFTVTLPVAKEGAQPLAAVDSSADKKPATVLVVDDNRDAAEILVELLQASGCEGARRVHGPGGARHRRRDAAHGRPARHRPARPLGLRGGQDGCARCPRCRGPGSSRRLATACSGIATLRPAPASTPTSSSPWTTKRSCACSPEILDR